MKRICLSAAFILAFLNPLSATTVQRLSFDEEIVRLSIEESEETPERSPVQEYLAKIEAQGGLKGRKANA
jgi:hypothetical protein